MPGILRLSGIEVGASAVIALVNVTGKIKPSRLPDKANDVQFALADGRTAYFPLFVADCIRLAGVQPRVPFELMRPSAHEVRVKTIDANDYTSELGGRNGNPAGGSEASAPPVSVHGNNHSQEKEVNIPARSIEIQHSNGPTNPAGAKFMGAYKAAIDVLIEAQVYAKRQGLLMEVHCEDVRCLAAVMMIQAGGR
jgi:hypothetical protein